MAERPGGETSWYDRLSSLYDTISWFEKTPIAAGLQILNPQCGEKVLEIGFGTGRALISLAESVGPHGEVFGIDSSPGMHAVARSAVERAGFEDRITLVTGDARSLPFRDHLFDALFMSFTLELFSDEDIRVILGECRRVLTAGGRMCIVSLSKTRRPGIGERVYERLHQIFPRYLDCRPIHLTRTTSGAGFMVSARLVQSLWGLPVEIVLCIVHDEKKSISDSVLG